MRKTISIYLYVLGAIQLLGMNLGAFFWFAWASGIAHAKRSSRQWVIAIHSVYLFFCAWGLAKWFLQPEFRTSLEVFGKPVDVPPYAVLFFLILMILVYGLPVLWLLNKKVNDEFIDQDETIVCRIGAPEM